MNITKNNNGFEKIASIFLTVLFSLLIIAGATYAFRGYIGQKGLNFIEEKEPLIGGDKDEGGCLVGAGYSWCESKNKCLRVWEEPCIDKESQILIEDYLKEHISELSPTKEVLGGKFYITNFSFVKDGQIIVDYEDGHIALTADVLYSIEGGEVKIDKFSIDNYNSYSPENDGDQSSTVNELTGLFAEKYNVAAEDIAVQITDDRGDYIRGSVKFSADENASGGYFFAKIDGDKYKIVIDGNGQIDCALVSDFPQEMVSDCVK